MRKKLFYFILLSAPVIFISSDFQSYTGKTFERVFNFLDYNFGKDTDAYDTDLNKQKEFLNKKNPVVISESNDISESSSNIPDIVCYKGPIPAYPSGIFGHASAVLGETLYVAGGVEEGISTNYVYRYNIPNNTWSPGRNMPFIKSGGDLVKCGNAIYYIGGGTSVSSGNFVVMRYRTTLGWDTVARIPVPVAGNTAESWGDSVIFCIAGGWSTYLGTVQVYRPSSNTWSVIADSLPVGFGRRTHASGIVDNKIFVASGFSGFFRNDMIVGTIGSNANQISWNAAENINCRGGMSRPGGTGIDGYFFVIGAETSPEPALQDSIFIYDTKSNNWLTPLSGRSGGASSNYWGIVSAKTMNNNVNVFIPGGSLPGTTQFGLYVARFGDCNPDPIDTVLVITGDSTLGTQAQINGRKSDRDTLFKYMNLLSAGYDVIYKDTSAATIPSVIFQYKTIILHELASDATPVRYMGTSWRNVIKNWMNSGSQNDKRTLILIGGDMAYNYGRSNSPVYDSVLSKVLGKFSYRSDNGNLPSENKITWLNGNYSDSMTTTPIGVNFWPDGCSIESGGTVLANYTGRTALDSLAIIGNAPSAGNYITVTILQDPRYFTGSGGDAGSPPVNDRGFSRVLRLALGWAKQNGGIITQTFPEESEITAGYILRQNFPNPFNPITRIDFSIPGRQLTALNVYDILGKQIAVIKIDVLEKGNYSFTFDGTNLPSGIYFYELMSGSFRQVRKMLLVK